MRQNDADVTSNFVQLEKERDGLLQEAYTVGYAAFVIYYQISNVYLCFPRPIPDVSLASFCLMTFREKNKCIVLTSIQKLSFV